MEEARGLKVDGRHLLGGQQHVGAGVAVEAYVFLAVGASGYEGEGGAGALGQAKVLHVHAGVVECSPQEFAERIPAHLADEAGADSKARKPYCDIGRGPASRAGEARQPGEGYVLLDGHEVDEQFAERDDLRHRVASPRLSQSGSAGLLTLLVPGPAGRELAAPAADGDLCCRSAAGRCPLSHGRLPPSALAHRSAAGPRRRGSPGSRCRCACHRRGLVRGGSSGLAMESRCMVARLCIRKEATPQECER